MSEARHSNALVVATLATVLVLPITYVLSVGPAKWLIDHDYLNVDLAEIIYYPILAIAELSETAMGFLTWYMSLFE